jgi:ABC-type dipeptide/oligopeptide/nickel transport system ATPase component
VPQSNARPLLFCKQGIVIERKVGQLEDRLVATGFGRAQEFALNEPGIYTLEGDNQSGKSVLIKSLMAVELPSLNVLPSRSTSTIILNGKQVNIGTVGDALTNGMVAVFQDDDLIPSMTIGEQYVMRHGVAKWRHWLNWILELFFDTKPFTLLRAALPGLAKPFIIIGQWIRGQLPTLYPAAEVINQARLRLQSYQTDDTDYVGILDKFPHELSGGAKAVARLVQAQLTPNIKVLFLDEAFSGVQANVWPVLVDKIKAWQEDAGAAVVVITHNEYERHRWSPSVRMKLDGGVLYRQEVSGYEQLVTGIPVRPDHYPVFRLSADDNALWLESRYNEFIVICDKSVMNHDSTNKIVKKLTRLSGTSPKIIAIDGGCATDF